MKQAMPDREWFKVRERLDRSRTDHRIAEETSIAAAIQRAEPGISRDDALRNAARIVLQREGR